MPRSNPNSERTSNGNGAGGCSKAMPEAPYPRETAGKPSLPVASCSANIHRTKCGGPNRTRPIQHQTDRTNPKRSLRNASRPTPLAACPPPPPPIPDHGRRAARLHRSRRRLRHPLPRLRWRDRRRAGRGRAWQRGRRTPARGLDRATPRHLPMEPASPARRTPFRTASRLASRTLGFRPRPRQETEPCR